MSAKLITLEMEDLSPPEAAALFGSKRLAFGQTQELGPGIEAENQSLEGLGMDTLSILTVVISTASSVGTGVAANAIYDWLKGRVTKINVNGKKVRVDPIALANVLGETKKDNARGTSESGRNDSG